MWSWRFTLFLLAAGVIWLGEDWVEKSQQSTAKQWLRRVPIYAELLDLYPDAVIVPVETED